MWTGKVGYGRHKILLLTHRRQPGVVAARGTLKLGVGDVEIVDGGDVLALGLRQRCLGRGNVQHGHYLNNSIRYSRIANTRV